MPEPENCLIQESIYSGEMIPIQNQKMIYFQVSNTWTRICLGGWCITSHLVVNKKTLENKRMACVKIIENNKMCYHMMQSGRAWEGFNLSMHRIANASNRNGTNYDEGVGSAQKNNSNGGE